MSSSLAHRLREATRELHVQSERSSLMAALLSGRIERSGYCALLRNLHALYETLERGLDRNAALPAVTPVRIPELYRTRALAADLAYLHGPDHAQLPLTRAMTAYVAHVEALATAAPALLPAHAYVRYLGDLSGGQLLRGIVQRTLALPEGKGTDFYAFGSAADVDARKAALRSALDRLPLDDAGKEALVAEAQSAFARHVAFFAELGRAL
jgi:heme oxygenase (biliverdin-producing, ferredoxin)